jgi:putative effector of murein hydrolase
MAETAGGFASLGMSLSGILTAILLTLLSGAQPTRKVEAQDL